MTDEKGHKYTQYGFPGKYWERKAEREKEEQDGRSKARRNVNE